MALRRMEVYAYAAGHEKQKEHETNGAEVVWSSLSMLSSLHTRTRPHGRGPDQLHPIHIQCSEQNSCPF